jgi:hypothetical protein
MKDDEMGVIRGTHEQYLKEIVVGEPKGKR